VFYNTSLRLRLPLIVTNAFYDYRFFQQRQRTNKVDAKKVAVKHFIRQAVDCSLPLGKANSERQISR
jgi:hypothetical protein